MSEDTPQTVAESPPAPPGAAGQGDGSFEPAGEGSGVGASSDLAALVDVRLILSNGPLRWSGMAHFR